MPIGLGNFLFQAQQVQIPGLLSGMGVINTVAAFAYSSALNCISGVKYRRLAALALFASWFASLMLVIAYVLESAAAEGHRRYPGHRRPRPLDPVLPVCA